MKVMYGIVLFFLGGSAGLFLISAESKRSVLYLICFFFASCIGNCLFNSLT